MSLTFLAVAFVVTPAMQQLCEDFRLAMKLARVEVKDAAETIGVHESRLYRQLEGNELFTLMPRFAEIPAVLDCVWWIRQMRTGKVVVLAPDSPVGQLLDLGQKTMAKMAMSLPSDSLQEKSA